MDEAELLNAGRRGDVSAFNHLVIIYQELVFNVCLRMLGNSESAADATQDAFINAFQALHGFRGGSFKSWLLRIATNACYDQLRRQKRRPTASLDGLMAEDEGIALPSSDPDPEEQALRHELWQHLQLGLATLLPEQRIVVILSDVEGMSYEEIAQVTGAALGTVKSRLSRGREHMRQFVLQHGELILGRQRQHDARGDSR